MTPKPKLADITWLRLDDLHVDDKYRQAPVPSRLGAITAAMTADPDPDLFGVLVVNKRPDGTYWVVDGAYRVLALRAVVAATGSPSVMVVPCQVLELGGVEEASLFFRMAQPDAKASKRKRASK